MKMQLSKKCQLISIFVIVIIFSLLLMILTLYNRPNDQNTDPLILQARKNLNNLDINFNDGSSIIKAHSLLDLNYNDPILINYKFNLIDENNQFYAYYKSQNPNKDVKASQIYPLVIVIDKNTHKIIEVAIGSEFSRGFGSQISKLNSIQLPNEKILFTGSPGIYDNIYPNLGMSVVSIGTQDNSIITGINFIKPTQTLEEYKSIYGTGLDSKLFRMYIYLGHLDGE